MGWRIKDKITVDPGAEDLILLEQNGNSRSTTFSRLKNWLLGTTELTTIDKTSNGAINEINAKVGDIDLENDGDVATQLNALMNNKVDKSTSNLRTYISLSQIGITETTTLLDVIQKLPLNSMIIWDYKSTITCSDTAPDNAGYGTMIILKYSTTRIILFYQSKDGFLYNTTANMGNESSTYINSWVMATISDSDFLDLPLASGVTNYSSYDGGKYRKINKTVKCTGRVTGLTGTTGTIGTLPSGYRPKQNCMFTTLTNGVVLINLLVDTTGLITFNCASPIASSNFITLDGIIFDI